MPSRSKASFALFWSHVDVTTPGQCWNWSGRLDHGYGKFGGTWAHRVAWNYFHGEIRGRLTIDHICRNRACMNPDHLRLRTRSQNASDIQTRPGGNNGFGLKTHCKRGHPFDKENTMLVPGGRGCRQCRRDYDRETKRLKQEAKAA